MLLFPMELVQPTLWGEIYFQGAFLFSYVFLVHTSIEIEMYNKKSMYWVIQLVNGKLFTIIQ